MHRNPLRLTIQIAMIVGIVFLAAITFVVLPAGATSGGAAIVSIGANCAPSSLVPISAAIVAEGTGDHEVVRYLSNPQRNSATASTTTWAEEPGVYPFTAPVPPDTQAGDFLVLIVAVTDSRGEVYGYQSIRYDCAVGYLAPPDATIPVLGEPDAGGTDGTDGAEDTETSNGNPASSPNVPTMNGQSACGIFALDGWGHKTIAIGDFPICTGYAPAVTVACLTATGAWTQQEVHNLTVAADATTLSFDVTQHGHCGIFPIGMVPATQIAH